MGDQNYDMESDNAMVSMMGFGTKALGRHPNIIHLLAGSKICYQTNIQNTVGMQIKLKLFCLNSQSKNRDFA